MCFYNNKKSWAIIQKVYCILEQEEEEGCYKKGEEEKRFLVCLSRSELVKSKEKVLL